MNFFKSIESIAAKVDLQLTISAKGDIMTVMVMPKATINDTAFSKIKPIVISGSAEDLDEGFLDAIRQPLEKVGGIVSNIVAFEASSKQLEKENSAAKAKEEQEKKKKDDNKKKYESLVQSADKFIADKKYSKAEELLNQALEVSENKEDLNKRFADLKVKMGQSTLFSADLIETETQAEDRKDYADERTDIGNDTEELNPEDNNEGKDDDE